MPPAPGACALIACTSTIRGCLSFERIDLQENLKIGEVSVMFFIYYIDICLEPPHKPFKIELVPMTCRRRHSQVVHGDRYECSCYLFLFEGASSNLAGVSHFWYLFLSSFLPFAPILKTDFWPVYKGAYVLILHKTINCQDWGQNLYY